MFFKKWRTKQESNTSDGSQKFIYQEQLEKINTSIQNINCTDELKNINNILSDKISYIISIFIIPGFYWLYNVSIEIINYYYWRLLGQNSLGFTKNPIINPFVELAIAGLFAALGWLLFQTAVKKNSIKLHKIIVWANVILLIISISIFFSLLITKHSINHIDFYKGKSTTNMIFFNIFTLIFFILLLLISYVFILKNLKENNLYFIGIFVYGLSAYFIITTTSLSYVIDQYMKMNQSFATETYKTSDDSILLKSTPNTNIFRIQCETKCFGYKVINMKNNEYTVEPIIFNPEDIDFANMSKS